MTSLHDWPEATKQFIDKAALGGIVASATLSQVALIVSIVAGILSAAWFVQRFIDRYRFGPPKND